MSVPVIFKFDEDPTRNEVATYIIQILYASICAFRFHIMNKTITQFLVSSTHRRDILLLFTKMYLVSIQCIGLVVLVHANRNMSKCTTKTYNKNCAASEDSDQPAHPRSLIRVFADGIYGMCLL